MPDLTDRAFLLAASLQAAHLELKSWRKIAKKYYGDHVHFATLNRIANSEGQWLPKDRKVLITLGLVERRRRTEIEKAVSRMARRTKKAVLLVKK